MYKIIELSLCDRLRGYHVGDQVSIYTKVCDYIGHKLYGVRFTDGRTGMLWDWQIQEG